MIIDETYISLDIFLQHAAALQPANTAVIQKKKLHFKIKELSFRKLRWAFMISACFPQWICPTGIQRRWLHNGILQERNVILKFRNCTAGTERLAE